MIKLLCASTIEIDDPNDAVEEVLDYIDMGSLLTSSVGIIGCNLEYITNGTVKKLCERLPFDIVGSTTYISDACGKADEYQLSLMILTSDTLSFATGATDPLVESPTQSIAKTYRHVAKNLPSEATFGIFVAPFMLELGADSQLKALNEASENIPLFGTVALDYIDSVRDPRTIHNGSDYADRLALLLVSGESEQPHFFVKSISDELFLKQKAVITASTGSILQEVNEIPAVEYLESLGLAKDGEIENIPIVPLSVDTGDGGHPAARAIFAVTPDGSVICGGDMPKNATLGVGTLESSDVQKTATELAKQIINIENSSGAIIFSCMGRNRALGLDPLHEIDQIQAVLGSSLPYLFMYSGGEIYPEIVQGKSLNKALNDSIIACIF